MRTSLTTTLFALTLTTAFASDALAAKVFESGSVPDLTTDVSFVASDDAVTAGEFYYNHTMPADAPTLTVQSVEFYGYEEFITFLTNAGGIQGFDLVIGPTPVNVLAIERIDVNPPVEPDFADVEFGPVQRIRIDIDPVQIGANDQVLIQGAGDLFTQFHMAVADNALAGIQFDTYNDADLININTSSFGDALYFAFYDQRLVPEPTSLALLSLGGLMVMRRRG